MSAPGTTIAPINPGEPRWSDAREDLKDALFERMVRECEDGRDPGEVHHEGFQSTELEALAALARSVARSASGIDEAPTFDDFEVIRSLGRGGMGAVFLARQRSLGGRWVALKVLPASFARSRVLRARFRREAAAIASLRHPNIVGVHAVAESDDGVMAYAMDFVDGLSLQELIDSLPGTGDPAPAMAMVRTELPRLATTEESYERFIALIGARVADALIAVHGAGLVHRDIKPSNIMLRADGTPLLTDFGLVRDESATMVTVEGSFAGTAAYASPEQLRGDVPAIGPRSDVYALGATIYHALAMKPAVENATPVALHAHLMERGAPPLRVVAPQVPIDLAAIVMKAMDPEPARRYQSASDMRDDLDRFLVDRPTRARPAGVMHRAGKFVRRNRRPVMWATVAALLVGVIALGTAAKVVWLPAMASESIERARADLLHPNRAAQLFNHAFWSADTEAPSAMTWGTLSDARAAYERALRLDGTRSDARAELDVVRRTLAIGQPDRLSEPRDAVGQYLHAAISGATGGATPPTWTRAPHAIGIDTASLSDADLRAVGLAAFLLNDVRTAIDAWTALEARTDTGGFVSGALGLVLLIEDEPERAYPRLHRAMLESPEVGFLAQYTAEAAMRCGDLAAARRFLDAARELGHHDVQADFRITLMIDLAEGKPDALERFNEVVRTRPNPIWSSVLAFQVGDKLLSLGRTEEALPTLAQAVSSTTPPLKVARVFVPAFERWWTDQDAESRLAFCRSLLDPTPKGAPMSWRQCAFCPIYVYAHPMLLTLPEGAPGARKTVVDIGARCKAPVELFGEAGNEFRARLDGVHRERYARWLLTGEGEPPIPLNPD